MGGYYLFRVSGKIMHWTAMRDDSFDLNTVTSTVRRMGSRLLARALGRRRSMLEAQRAWKLAVKVIASSVALAPTAPLASRAKRLA